MTEKRLASKRAQDATACHRRHTTTVGGWSLLHLNSGRVAAAAAAAAAAASGRSQGALPSNAWPGAAQPADSGGGSRASGHAGGGRLPPRRPDCEVERLRKLYLSRVIHDIPVVFVVRHCKGMVQASTFTPSTYSCLYSVCTQQPSGHDNVVVYCSRRRRSAGDLLN